MRPRIKRVAGQASKLVSAYLPLREGFDVYCSKRQTSDRAFSETLTGMSYETGLVICEFYQTHFDANELLHFLTHELNHVYRNTLYSTESDPTLFNWMLNEGLADSFTRQIAQDHKLDWRPYDTQNTGTPRPQLLHGLSDIITIGASDNWDYYDWFYNLDHGNTNFPTNYAYQIGDLLVTEFCEQHQLTPAQATEHPPAEFLKFAQHITKGSSHA